MLVGKYEFNITLGGPIPGFPDIKISQGNPPSGKRPSGVRLLKFPIPWNFSKRIA